eukprot:TRINITY_DN28457_c0_g1_i1.p1 TRINITY_DN28457_c0_g1~~TRINITY_DN28457_c0_g1_i1.p1  ORF type:complete len:598 (+),score=102.14 TRINITY_DN28457_c0_g1_i1:191-1984(+)
MIEYDAGRSGLAHILRCHGSCMPKAALVATICGLLAAGCNVLYRRERVPGYALEDLASAKDTYTAFSGTLGFLLAFRCNQAYGRWWDGVVLLRRTTREVAETCSQIIAMTATSTRSDEDLRKYRHTLVRCFSLMSCCFLQHVTEMEDEDFDIIPIDGIDATSAKFLVDKKGRPEERCAVVLHWVLRLIIEGAHENLIAVEPPIVTRALQELHHGVLRFEDMRTISEIPLPFPYAQMLAALLLVHLPVTVFVVSGLMQSALASALCAGLPTFMLWCFHFIFIEIEQPFGDDANDLNVQKAQEELNDSLKMLLKKSTTRTPFFSKELSLSSIESQTAFGQLRRQSMLPFSYATTMEKMASGLDGNTRKRRLYPSGIAEHQDDDYDVVVRAETTGSEQPPVVRQFTASSASSAEETDAGGASELGEADRWLPVTHLGLRPEIASVADPHPRSGLGSDSSPWRSSRRLAARRGTKDLDDSPASQKASSRVSKPGSRPMPERSHDDGIPPSGEAPNGLGHQPLLPLCVQSFDEPETSPPCMSSNPAGAKAGLAAQENLHHDYANGRHHLHSLVTGSCDGKDKALRVTMLRSNRGAGPAPPDI